MPTSTGTARQRRPAAAAVPITKAPRRRSDLANLPRHRQSPCRRPCGSMRQRRKLTTSFMATPRYLRLGPIGWWWWSTSAYPTPRPQVITVVITALQSCAVQLLYMRGNTTPETQKGQSWGEIMPAGRPSSFPAVLIRSSALCWFWWWSFFIFLLCHISFFLLNHQCFNSIFHQPTIFSLQPYQYQSRQSSISQSAPLFQT
jgi:hypothetical protein